MNFVPCMTWVKRGVSKRVPDKIQLTQEELKRMTLQSAEEYRTAKSDAENSESELETQKPEINSVDDDMDSFNADEYHLDSYDDDDDNNNNSEIEDSRHAPLLKPEDLEVAFDDPYAVASEDEWEDDEKEDFLIQDNDNLLVVGHVENESSTLEIYVYNEEDGDFYVHHDIVLPAYPVTLEWLNFCGSGKSQGNYIAVGDMTPLIKIWDLDVVDGLEPLSSLGAESDSLNHSNDAHSDAVLTLGWNKESRNTLASGSADEKICLWDLEKQKSVATMNLQRGKVQSLQWHPQESQYLLSGTTNGCVFLGDCRTSVDDFTSFCLDGEVEKVLWNHFNPFLFLCSTDKGTVYCMDVRTNQELFTISAHSKAVTGLSLSSECEGCLITSSTDKTIKIWDISDKPELIASQKLKIGSIFAASFCPDSPFIVACGGDRSSNNLVVKNLLELQNCEDVFGPRLTPNC